MGKKVCIFSTKIGKTEETVILSDVSVKILKGFNANSITAWALKTFSQHSVDADTPAGIQRIDNQIGETQKPGRVLFLPGTQTGKSSSKKKLSHLFFGLTLDTSGIDIISAVFEGIAYHYYQHISSLINKHQQIEIFVSGRAYLFDSFCQILSDIFNKRVSRPKTEVRIAHPCSMHTDKAHIETLKCLSSLSDSEKIDKAFLPDTARHEEYMHHFSRFKSIQKSINAYLIRLTHIRTE